MQLTLADRLWERRGEIEQLALARMHAISDPTDVEDPDYVAGLHQAVASGFAFGVAAIEVPGIRDSGEAPVPIELLSQARYAARSRVSLDTVLRRYFAGYTLLGDFLVQVADEGAVPSRELRRALRGTGYLFDRLVESVTDEYTRELDGRTRTAEERRAAQVRMLLNGQPVDGVDFGYELDAWHLGIIAEGSGAQAILREMAAGLDRRLLAVDSGEGMIWAWFGGRAKVNAHEALFAAKALGHRGAISVGEPAHGIEGWRLSHRQAKAAMLVARVDPARRAAYADVVLLASALADGMLAGSLREIYLSPLTAERDGGAALRKTLTTYFAAGRNASSTAAALGVSRQTVRIRLRTVEERIGRPLDSCAAELETALRLEGLQTVSL